MNVNELLDTIEDTLEEKHQHAAVRRQVWWTWKRSGIVDDISRKPAGELRRAQPIVNDHAPVVDTANAKAQAIVKAEERARILVSDAEIVKSRPAARRRDPRRCPEQSRTLRQTVTDYCDNMLKTTEEAMVENAAQVKNVRANLRQNAKKNG